MAVAGSAQCAVRASVDNNSVGADAQIELMLEHDGQTSAEPDLSPLKQDFDVLSTSRSSNVQIINGSMTSSVRLVLSLSPKHGGRLEIPAITWGSEKSNPLGRERERRNIRQPTDPERSHRPTQGVSQDLD